eukprot:5630451-Pleurochrysis_carterae.AAC.1
MRPPLLSTLLQRPLPLHPVRPTKTPIQPPLHSMLLPGRTSAAAPMATDENADAATAALDAAAEATAAAPGAADESADAATTALDAA